MKRHEVIILEEPSHGDCSRVLSGQIPTEEHLLTLHYIFGRNLVEDKWSRLCAQALIYSKVVRKEETLDSEAVFPHARNEIESINAVNHLTLDCCRILFQQIRNLSPEDAADAVKSYCGNSRL